MKNKIQTLTIISLVIIAIFFVFASPIYAYNNFQFDPISAEFVTIFGGLLIPFTCGIFSFIIANNDIESK